MTQWPVTLPLPNCEAQGAPKHATLASELTSAKISRRSRFYAAPVGLSVQWVFSPAQMDAFETFFLVDLDNGAAQFEIELRYPDPLALQVWRARLMDGYESQFDGGLWVVGASIEMTQTVLSEGALLIGWEFFYVRPEVEGDDLLVVLLDQFLYATKT